MCETLTKILPDGGAFAEYPGRGEQQVLKLSQPPSWRRRSYTQNGRPNGVQNDAISRSPQRLDVGHGVVLAKCDPSCFLRLGLRLAAGPLFLHDRGLDASSLDELTNGASTASRSAGVSNRLAHRAKQPPVLGNEPVVARFERKRRHDRADVRDVTAQRGEQRFRVRDRHGGAGHSVTSG